MARLRRGRSNFRVHFTASQVAASLWDYGEDELAARAVEMSDDDLAAIQGIASWYEDATYPLPREGRITHRHVHAFAAITHFEEAVRPLARDRARPAKHRPAEYTPLPPNPNIAALQAAKAAGQVSGFKQVRQAPPRAGVNGQLRGRKYNLRSAKACDTLDVARLEDPRTAPKA